MQIRHQTIRSLFATLACGLSLGVGSSSVVAQSKQRPPTGRPASQTLPPANTGAATRGRVVSTPEGRAVNAALKTALGTAAVRTAVHAEVLRQLRVRRPLALVQGHFVTKIDLASVYQLPNVRPVLLSALGSNGPQILNAAGVSADRLTISIVPAALGSVMFTQFTRDIRVTIGVDALKTQMTDIGPYVMIAVLAVSGLGIVISVAESLAAFVEWLATEDTPVYPEGPTYDYDGDGLMNMDDPDDDGDGVNDTDDNYPFDKDRSICDCGRPPGTVALTGRGAGDFLPAIAGVLTAVRPATARAVPLGALLPNRPNTVAILF